MLGIRFVWGYRNSNGAWLDKHDAMQTVIRRLGRNMNVAVAVLSDSDSCIECDGIRWHFFTSQKFLFDYLSKDSPDVILLNGPAAFDLELMQGVQARTQYGLYSHGDVDFLPTHYRHCRVVFAHHQYQAEKLSKGFPNLQFFVAPHTVDLDAFRPMKRPIEWDVLYPARRDTNKRPWLLEAACELAGLSLRITDGHEYRPCEMPEVYNRTRVVGMVSHREAGPRVLLEAMACNIPTVACSDCPANVEYTLRFGGYLADPDPVSIARVLAHAIGATVDTRARLEEAGFDHEHMLHCVIQGLSCFNERS